jgi:hypothetical protein
MHFRAAVTALALAPLLAACALRDIPNNITAPTEQPNVAEQFVWCSGFGCKRWHYMKLDAGQQATIAAYFATPAATPAEERRQVTLAVAEMERITGAMIGTHVDVGGTMFTNMGDDGKMQLDCFAEASNSTISLQIFAAKGWLRHHTIGAIVLRGFPYNDRGGMFTHATAVLVQNSDGRGYAIDSWYTDNGGEVYAVDIDEWLDGWHPPGIGLML